MPLCLCVYYSFLEYFVLIVLDSKTFTELGGHVSGYQTSLSPICPLGLGLACNSISWGTTWIIPSPFYIPFSLSFQPWIRGFSSAPSEPVANITAFSRYYNCFLGQPPYFDPRKGKDGVCSSLHVAPSTLSARGRPSIECTKWMDK